MIFTLLSHSWLSFWRSKSLARSLGTAIFTWLMVAIMVLYALGLGYMLEELLVKLAPEKDSIKLLNGLLLFYWMFELVSRIIIQKNVTLNVQHYLTQRISSQSLAHFMLLKSWINLFLLITVLLFSRFAFHKIALIYGVQQGWVWLLFLLGVSFCLHHLVILIHQISKGRIWLPLGLSIITVATIYASFLGHIDILFITEGVMGDVLVNPFLLLTPYLISLGLYFVTHFFIKKNLLLDNLTQNVSIGNVGVPSWVQYLNTKGVVGQLFALEVRLIWRNKRARTTLIMGVFFLFYVVIAFQRNGIGEKLPEFLAMLSTGAFMINYAQLIFSWESFYIDMIMANDISIKKYMKSKIFLLFILNSISLLSSVIILIFINPKIISTFLLWYLVNTGLFIYLFIWLAILGAKRIDSNASAFFNYEGINISQFLIIIPYVALPVVARFVIDKYLGVGMGTYILAGLGVIGILLFKPIVDLLAKSFLKRKHKILVRLRD